MKKINDWYNNLKEPYRFLFAIGISIPFIVGMTEAKYFNYVGIIIWVIYLFFYFWLIFYRAFKKIS